LAKKVFLPESTSLVIEDGDLDEDLIDLLVDPLERRTLYGNVKREDENNINQFHDDVDDDGVKNTLAKSVCQHSCMSFLRVEMQLAGILGRRPLRQI
jgi:hypothetical protein